MATSHAKRCNWKFNVVWVMSLLFIMMDKMITPYPTTDTHTPHMALLYLQWQLCLTMQMHNNDGNWHWQEGPCDFLFFFLCLKL